MFLFSTFFATIAATRSHLVFLTAEVTNPDGTVDNYEQNAYSQLISRLNQSNSGILAASTRQVALAGEAQSSQKEIFQEIERTLADLESRDDFGPADTYFACHGTSCPYLSSTLSSGLWEDRRRGVIYMGAEPMVFDEFGRPRPREFLTDMRKIAMIGQFDGKFTVSHAARLEPLVSLSNTYFALIDGARHSSFGNFDESHFKMDDVINADHQNDDIDNVIIDFVTENKESLENYDRDARLTRAGFPFSNSVRDYWAPLGEALRFEREYKSDNTDENWLFPNDDCLDTPLNWYIQNDILNKQLAGTGITYQNTHEWRLPYKDENSDIGSPKPTVNFNGTHVTTDSYTHDYFLPHFQFNGRNEVTATLTNSSSVDIQMKFKNQKWIAREIGIQDWADQEVDNCGTYQNQFFGEAFEKITNSRFGHSILEQYEKNGCQVGVEEPVTTVGIFWLETPVHYTFKRVSGRKKMLIRANNMYTDENNTSESEMDRLGGMLYCRLAGPARFMEWIMIDGLRKSNLDQC